MVLYKNEKFEIPCCKGTFRQRTTVISNSESLKCGLDLKRVIDTGLCFSDILYEHVNMEINNDKNTKRSFII